MKKILLTGASGLLGQEICRLGATILKIEGISFSNTPEIPGISFSNVDLTNESRLSDLFKKIQPQGVIHTAAISNANYCQQHPTESYKLNVTVSKWIARYCAENRLPLVFTSSDLVYDGKKGGYTEEDAVNPVSVYGEQKSEAERAVTAIYPQAAICRLPLLIGWWKDATRGHLRAFVESAKTGGTIKLFTDEWRSPLAVDSAAAGIIFALENLSGIYHLGGAERLSRFELGQKIVKTFELQETLISATRQSDVPMFAPRPRDVSLNSGKAFAKGFQPEKIGEQLQKIKPEILQNSAPFHKA